MTDLLSTLAEVTLYEGYQIVFEALDPTTGAAVAGVKINSATITAEDLSSPIGGGAIENAVPLLTPLSLEDQYGDAAEAA